MEATVRKDYDLLKVKLNGKTYKVWLWTPLAIKKETRRTLLKNGEWLACIEKDNGTSKNIKIKVGVGQNPYYVGLEYLNKKMIREQLKNLVINNI